MKIEPQAFIAIERTMAAALRSQWDVVARGLLDRLHPLLEAKKWGQAQEAVNQFTLDGIVGDVRPKIEELCVSALLFGAHHASGDVKSTAFAKGKAVPQELHNAIAQLEHMVEANGRDYVCNQLHAAIEAMKRGDAASHLQKDDPYHDAQGRFTNAAGAVGLVGQADVNELEDKFGVRNVMPLQTRATYQTWSVTPTPDLTPAKLLADGWKDESTDGARKFTKGAAKLIDAAGKPGAKFTPNLFLSVVGSAATPSPAQAQPVAAPAATATKPAATPAAPGSLVATPVTPAKPVAEAAPAPSPPPSKPAAAEQPSFPAITPEDERGALMAYQETAYMAINDELRRHGGDVAPVTFGAYSRYSAGHKIRGIDAVMAKNLTTKPQVLWRGASSKLFAGGAPKVGDTFVDHGFVSTSRVRSEGQGFAKKMGDGKLVKVVVPPGVGAIDFVQHKIGDSAAKEKEVLLDRGHAFRVASVDGGVVTLEMQPYSTSGVGATPVRKAASGPHDRFVWMPDDITFVAQKHDVYTEKDKRPDAQVAEDYDPATEPDLDGAAARRREKFFGQAAYAAKDDISDEQLAETGGLLEPEQAEARPKRKKGKQFLTKKDGAKTLYVRRSLLNGAQLIAWAKTVGFESAQEPDDMHVTICYSKEPFDWDDLQPKDDNITLVGGRRGIQTFGDAVVLTFDSDLLSEDHQELIDAGASTDFPEYHPHVTITWGEPPRPVEEIEPFQGVLDFGPELFAPINKDWQKDHEELVLKWERLLKADDRSLADKLNDAVARGGTVAIDTGAQLTTSRLVSLGFLAQAVEQGTTTYVVNEVLDDRTCPVCQYMHGKTFSVQQQFDRAVHQLAATDPASLRDLAPWPGQSEADIKDLHALSGEELQAQGYGAPPYHLGCRGMITMVGTATETIPLGGPARPADVDTLTQLMFPAEAAEEAAAPVATGSLTPDEIEHLKWARFDVTDPRVFSKVTDLFDAGEYEEAQQLVDEWKSQHNVAKDDGDETQGFDGPNAPKKKRKLQTPSGREQDYSDISSDSSSIAFDCGVSNDALAPLDRL